jgi:LCP family protein required for cell wall assembly
MSSVTEMDRSRFKRPGTQKPSQTKNKNFGNSAPSPKFSSLRSAEFIIDNDMPSGNTRLPVLRPMKTVVELNQNSKAQENTPPSAINPSTPRVPLDMGLPGAESPSTPGRLNRFKIPRRARRNLTRGLAVAIVLVLTFGGLVFSQNYIKIHKVFKGSTATAAALQVNVNPNLLKGEGSGRINVLLLGRGGGDHDGPDLTDSMMLDSIDPVNHTSTLISIPRDLWVNIPGAGAMKINAAWETGEFKYLGKVESGSTNTKAIQAGYNEVDQTVKSVLGVSIDYNVLVNFQAFQQAVDAVGGVTVNVPTDLVDPTMAWQNGNNPVLATAGVDNFDGNQALNYVRSRETTSDFARAQRQRAVLLAIKNKVETLGTLSNPLKIESLINSFGDNVSTDLSLKDATRLFGIVNDIPNNKVNSVGLADSPNNYVTTGTLAGQSIDLPTAGLFDYTDIQQFVRTQLKDPYVLKENAKILVLNGTQTPGLATTLATSLETYGYNVIGVANAPSNDISSTTLYDLNSKDPYTKNYLQQRFDQKAKTVLNDKSINTDGADFVIIIGTNEANTTQP